MFFRLVVVLVVTQYLVLSIPMVVVVVDGDVVWLRKSTRAVLRGSSSWFLVVRNLSHT